MRFWKWSGSAHSALLRFASGRRRRSEIHVLAARSRYQRSNMTVNGSFFDKIRPFWDIQYTVWHPTAVDLKSQFLTISLTKISKNLNEIREDHFSIWYNHFGPSESVSEWFWWCSKKVDFWPFLLCFLGEKWPFRTIRGQQMTLNWQSGDHFSTKLDHFGQSEGWIDMSFWGVKKGHFWPFYWCFYWEICG